MVFCFLGNKMCKFYHVPLVRLSHSKRFRKLSLKFQKIKFSGLQSSLLSKIVVLQLENTVPLLQL